MLREHGEGDRPWFGMCKIEFDGGDCKLHDGFYGIKNTVHSKSDSILNLWKYKSLHYVHELKLRFSQNYVFSTPHL